MVFFSGWMGYATSYSPGAFAEPTDTAYARRPVTFSQPGGSYSVAQNGGTVGPAGANWGLLVYVGLFGASSGGLPVLVMPLARPVNVPTGSTFSENAAAYTLRVFGARDGSTVWPQGAIVARTQYGADCVTGTTVQYSDGAIKELALVMNAATSAGSLPSQPGASGTLWVNGGVISVS
ncbi:hypothetical protein FHR90_002848 [Endobacter medicaginis]|jgi:hypothetical protein|uniref:Uncharacterized protein n=1 Tax=Endobacter medicaginis TaxID=1181271 RepID=A0A839V6D2_9PROT|nr:hypothetical protein [Endobacter medicaginis]MBB3175001.1 hypothetical protein [Endobacter medicaginis]MCX5475923.1 hypothetical protein [Endobacter medicaginis]NVN28851.1 hypothetical protein [Endobacter medicaginis]